MPNRIIKESIRTSKSVNGLTDFQFRLWVYLITYVDDYGRGSADPELLKAFLFPRRKGITDANIRQGLHDLASAGLIQLYTVDGESYLQFPKWATHQRIRNCKAKFPSPDEADQTQYAADCGELPQVAADCGELRPESNPIQSESNPNPNPNPKRRAPARLPFGAYGQVKLTADEYQRLIDDLGQKELDRVLAYVDEYVQTTGKRYKDFNAVLRKASREGWGLKQSKPPKSMQPGTNTNPTPERIKANADWLDEFLAEQEAGGG